GPWRERASSGGGVSGSVALLVLLPGAAGARVVAADLRGLPRDLLATRRRGDARRGAGRGAEDRLLLPPALLLLPAPLLVRHRVEQEQEAHGVVLDSLLHHV